VASSLALPRDRLDRATFEGLFAEGDFLGCHGLSGDVGMGRPVITREEVGRMVPALVAVDTFIVDVKGTGGVLGVSMM
jgi:hypothetical protein